MKQYLDLCRHVLTAGEPRADRTGTGTRSVFGAQLMFDLSEGFPAVTTKRLYFGQVAAELACFLNQRETLQEFNNEGCIVWDANVNASQWKRRLETLADTPPDPRDYGSPDWVGRHYGLQWRGWRDPTRGRKIDQLRQAVETLRLDSSSRRAVVTAWNPSELEDVCLPPCHVMYQFSLRGLDAPGPPRLDCWVVMRSVDVFLGMPFDVASYALLVHLAARELGAEPGRLFMWFGDTHVYSNHLEQVRQQLARTPLPLPRLALHPSASLDNFKAEYAQLDGYDSHPPIRGALSV